MPLPLPLDDKPTPLSLDDEPQFNPRDYQYTIRLLPDSPFLKMPGFLVKGPATIDNQTFNVVESRDTEDSSRELDVVIVRAKTKPIKLENDLR